MSLEQALRKVDELKELRKKKKLIQPFDGDEILGEQPPVVKSDANYGIISGKGRQSLERVLEEIAQGKLELVGDDIRWQALIKRMAPFLLGAVVGVAVEEGIRVVVKRRHQKTPGQSATKRPED